jgi:hypothetical protein
MCAYPTYCAQASAGQNFQPTNGWCNGGLHVTQLSSPIRNDKGGATLLTVGYKGTHGIEGTLELGEAAITVLFSLGLSGPEALMGYFIGGVLITKTAYAYHEDAEALAMTADCVKDPSGQYYAFTGCADSETRVYYNRVPDVTGWAVFLGCQYPGSIFGPGPFMPIGTRSGTFPNTPLLVSPHDACVPVGAGYATGGCSLVGDQVCETEQLNIVMGMCSGTAANQYGTCSACDACRAGGGNVIVGSCTGFVSSPDVTQEVRRTSRQRVTLPSVCCDTVNTSCAQQGFIPSG